jgi:hypothetical protein
LDIRGKVNSTGFVKGEKVSYMTVDIIPEIYPSITFRMILPLDEKNYDLKAGDIIAYNIYKP